MADQIQASHILLMWDGSLRTTATRSQDEAKQKIATIKAEIEGGLSFEEAAKQHSDCPSSSQGGDLGSFGRGMMVPEFEEALEKLKPGEISQPVRTSFGFHIIRVNERRTPVAGGCQTPEELAPFQNEVYQEEMERQKLLWVSQLRKKAFVEIRL